MEKFLQIKRLCIFILLFTFMLISVQAFSTTIFVNCAATGSNNGTSWANAFTTLDAAHNVALPGDQIWVAKGTYYPSLAYSLTNSPRFYHFRLRNGRALYGGFAGTEDLATFNLDDRDFVANETILSGDIGIPGDNSDNCYHLFYHPFNWGLTSSTILDGFTIADGNANAGDPHNNGAGMFNETSSPTISNVIFRSNSAINYGGAMYNDNSSPILTNVTFESNSASSGGAMWNDFNSVLNLTNTTFLSNSAQGHGGAIYCRASSLNINNSRFESNSSNYGGAINIWNSTVNITNTTFLLNSAIASGGALYCNGTSPTITNSLFESNSASGGGAMYCYYASPTITNVSFLLNSAASNGGALSNNNSSPSITNSKFESNSAAYGGAISNDYGASPSITNSLFSYNSVSSAGGAMFNSSNSSPIITNSTFSLNSSELRGGAIHSYNNSSPIFNNCIIWGNTAVIGNQFFVETGNITLNYSCYANAIGDVEDYYGDAFIATNNNITLDPLFRNSADGDFTLYSTSPCVNAGNNSFNIKPYDIRNQARIQNTTIDMGAYEWTSNIDIDCGALTSGGAISSEPFLCPGSTTTINSISPAANSGVALIDYLWQESIIGGSSGFTDINSSNANSLNTGSIAQKIWYKRLAKNNCSDDWTNFIESNVVEIDVHPIYAIAESYSICNGETYTWHGIDYTTDGTYTHNYLTVAGCDSIYTLNLIVNESTTSSTTETACDSFDWNGTSYTTSGVYTYNATNALGCDSVATLHLTINHSTTSSTSEIACDNFDWNGTAYTTSGVYTYNATNALGCDSVATLHLTINQSTTSSTTETACDNFDWNGTAYTTSGDYTYTTTNALGCDSVATLHLTINETPATATITLDGNVLHSDAINGNQWYDANGLINGAINQTYTVIADGDYYVVVSLLGCSSDLSNTISVIGTGLELAGKDRIINMYPNPVSTELIIEIEGNTEKLDLEIINAIGQVVYQDVIVERTTVQTSNLLPGIYTVKINNGKSFDLRKIVKE